VLCVTHLPQLASYGDIHYKVGKKVVGERTVAFVQELGMDGRLEELAQMLGTATEVTRQSAQEILEEVKKAKDAV
jgi:DNA repair protein RecN (Recombination protein N)